MITLSVVTLVMQFAAPMVLIPAGHYRPLYATPGAVPIHVVAFRLDREPVTRDQFAKFLQLHPEWQRSAIRPSLADRSTYLADWRDDLNRGDNSAQRVVTNVSWFAARAYCAARSARLPTVAEWEYAAAAGRTKRDATQDPMFLQYVLSLYATRATSKGIARNSDRNVYGLRGMHGLVWEWTDDFNDGLVSGDVHSVSHSEHDLSCAGGAVGASDPTNYPAFLRYALRASLTQRSSLETLGFRCAM